MGFATSMSAQGKIRRAIRLSFAVCAATTSVLPAMAYADDPDSSAGSSSTGKAAQLQSVEITGSRIRRVDAASANPVLTLTAKQIQATGATSLGDVLQSLPVVSGAMINSQYNNPSSGGAADVSLRGLTSSRTLLLLDGERLISTDINQIPINMIDRIEILKEGASAVYGSDAIGGVVNVITRKKFTGFEASAYYGRSDQNDDGTVQFDALWGDKSSKGREVLGLSYNRNEAIHSSDRDWSASPVGVTNGGVYPLANASVYSPYGDFQVCALKLPDGSCGAVTFLTRAAGTTGTSVTDYRHFNLLPYDQPITGRPSDLYNYQTENLVLSPTSHFSAFGEAERNLFGDTKWFGNAYYTHTHSYNQLAPEALDLSSTSLSLNQTVKIDKDSYYNPFTQDIVEDLVRTVSAGDRNLISDTDTYQLTTGIKGELLDRYNWTLSGTYGREVATYKTNGYLDVSSLPDALGPSFMDSNGVVTCGTAAAPIANCTPIDLLGTTGTSIGTLERGTQDSSRSGFESASASLGGDLLKLWAGPVGFDLGAQYRHYDLTYTPDALAEAYHLSEANSQATSGGFSVSELYGEFLIPLAKDQFWAYQLNFDLGVRGSYYSSFQWTENNKYAIEYRPIKDLLIRATYADIFRAPTTSDLYGGKAQDAPYYQDPCNGLNTTDNPQSVQDACQGVPTDGSYQQRGQQANANYTSNPTLKPETGYTTDFGLVYSPNWYQPLSIDADYWMYKVKDAISTLGLQSSLNACYNYDQFCDNFTRDSSGNLISAVEPTTNSDRFDTTGLDFGIHLDYPHTPIGIVQLSIDTTYLQDFNYKVIVAGQTTDNLSTAGAYDPIVFDGGYPRIRSTGTLSWQLGNYSANVTDRFLSNVNEAVPAYSLTPTCPPNMGYEGGYCNRRIGSANYVDLSLGYKIKSMHTQLTFGVNDMFSEGAQVAYSAVPATVLSMYNGVGRYFYGKMVVSFQ